MLEHFLFLDKLNIAEAVGSEGNSLTEPVILTVGNIKKSENLALKTFVEFLASVQLILEWGRSGKNQTFDVALVISNEVLHWHFTALSDICVTLLNSLTGESHRRLTSSSVLFGELHGHALEDLSVASLESTEKYTITIHDNESELLIIFEKSVKGFSVERVLALVLENVNGLEGLDINHNFFLWLSVFHHDDSAENAKTVLRSIFVQLELFFARGDSRLDRLTGLTRLNVVGTCQFLTEHGTDLLDGFLGRDVQSHKWSTISKKGALVRNFENWSDFAILTPWTCRETLSISWPSTFRFAVRRSWSYLNFQPFLEKHYLLFKIIV
jgi:hypothetical protein